MSVKSLNQNRHLYVAKAYNASVSEASAVGTIGGVKVIGEGNEKELVIFYKGPNSTLKSDHIQLKNLDYAKVFSSAAMLSPLKKVKVVLDPNVNGGDVVVGQDYILRIDFLQWIGPSENYQYVKDAVVHATQAMFADKKEFYKAMVAALNLSFSRELGANKTSNPYLEFSAGTAGSEDGIYITEKEQEWRLGIESLERVMFNVVPTTIYTGVDEIWGTVADITPAKYIDDPLNPGTLIPNPALIAGSTAIGNGKNIADLEYFCMGERGDQYRNMGWPNVIPTQYLADATKEYNVLEFHHAFTDQGVNSYRSEKDITIVADDASVLNSLIGAINTAAGTSIATI
jgi:hypothetical protein